MAEVFRRHAAVVTDSNAEAEPSAPSFITPKARTIIYITSLVVTVVTTLALGIAQIVGALTIEQATAIGALVYGAVAMVDSSLSVGFRPTRPVVTTTAKRAA